MVEGSGDYYSCDDFESKLCQEYFILLDTICSSLKYRFQKEDLQILRLMEKALMSVANGRPIASGDLDQIGQQLSAFYDFARLGNELTQLHLMLKMHNSKCGSAEKIKEVTNMSTVAYLLNEEPSSKICLPTLNMLIKIYYTIPLSPASAERSFSTMRRLKTWLRSTSGGNHLNNIMFANLHKQLLDEVNIEQIAATFISASEDSRHYFGKL